MPLNESNQDLLINFLEYWEIRPNGRQQHFSWVTDFPLDQQNVAEIMRAGRARWKIENETFNTLKNQGYQFEHNFGHGGQNLSVVFAVQHATTFIDSGKLSFAQFVDHWTTKCATDGHAGKDVQRLLREAQG